MKPSNKKPASQKTSNAPLGDGKSQVSSALQMSKTSVETSGTVESRKKAVPTETGINKQTVVRKVPAAVAAASVLGGNTPADSTAVTAKSEAHMNVKRPAEGSDSMAQKALSTVVMTAAKSPAGGSQGSVVVAPVSPGGLASSATGSSGPPLVPSQVRLF